MGLMDGLGDKAKDLAGDEQKTDQGLDAASEKAKEATGGKFDDQVDKAREFGDGKLGDDK